MGLLCSSGADSSAASGTSATIECEGQGQLPNFDSDADGGPQLPYHNTMSANGSDG